MRLQTLDGIRGLAILMVIAYHHLLFPLGWSGVDLFFVLSGYLITRILRGSRQSPVYWKRFYMKRMARLVPALIVTFTAVVALFRHVSFPGLIAYLLFLGDYADTRPGLYILPLAALWFLAVEEHFYLVWPSFVRQLRWSTLVFVICATLCAEPLLRLLVSPHLHDPRWLYYLTPFRLDGIAFGSLLGLLSERERVMERVLRWSGPALLLSLVLLMTIWRFVPSYGRDRHSLSFDSSGYSLAALTCFFAVAWVLSLKKESSPARALSWKPLAYVGRISYGMYLFQSVLLAVLQQLLQLSGKARPQMRWLFPLDLLLTIIVASVVFRFVEEPCLAWGTMATARLDAQIAREEVLAVRNVPVKMDPNGSS